MDYSYSYPAYRGIYYQFNVDRWILYRNYIEGLVMWFSDESYRIDQCIKEFIQEEIECSKLN